ncbi:MAG: hypothetical protein AABX17_00705 [Nanoarchaeota archaeon]
MKTLTKYLMTLIGILVVSISLFLAIFLKYNHFYEFLLIGLILILYPLTAKLFSKKNYLILYFLLFFIGGLLGDLIFGVLLGKVWFYNYSSTIEYILVYFLIYPLGGLVMIQSFLFFIRNKELKKDRMIDNRILLFLSILSLILCLFFIASKIIYNTPYSGFWLVGLFWIFISIYPNYLSEKKKGISYIRILLSNPKIIIVATIVSTYINAFLHEYPNLYANQWVYQNLIFPEVVFLGIPIVVLIGWLALSLFPVSLYYLVRGIR